MKSRNLWAVSLFTLVSALMFTNAASAEEDRRVKIINETGVTMMELYGSNVGTDDWEEDVLGADVVDPYGAVTVDFDDGSGYCLFDFKAVFADGEIVTRNKIDVCEVGVWRISE